MRFWNRHREERGVVAIATAIIVCFVMIPVAALAVDIGVQRVARTDMQSLADMVALDLARHLDTGKTATQWTNNDPSIQDLADKSLALNNNGAGKGAAVAATLGTFDTTTGDFTELPAVSDEVPDAVRVVASTTVSFGFKPGEGGATRSAIAQAKTSACFQVGSYAASITPANSELFGDMLKPLIGSSTIGAVGYNGLASTKINLLDVVESDYIGVGTVSELLSMDNLTVAKVFRASAAVLRARGLLAEANVFDLAAVSAVASTTIDLGDLFGLSTAGDAALDTDVNALDLLLGTVFLANGDHLLDIDNLQASLGSVAVTNTSLKVIQRPQIACDKDEAKTAQVRLTSDIKVSVENSPLLNQGGAQLRLVDLSGSNDNNIALHLDANLAGARAKLREVSCNPDTFDIDVWSELASLSLTGQVHLAGTVALNLLGVAGVSVPIKLDLAVTASTSNPAAGPTPTQIKIPPMTYDDHATVGSADQTLPQLNVSIVPGTLQVIGNVTVKVLGIPVVVPTGDILSALNPVLLPLVAGLAGTGRIGSVVNPLIDKLNVIVGQLSSGLGLNLGGADVWGLPTPNCRTPVLRG